MPRENPFAVDFSPAQARAFSLFELLLLPVVVAVAYLVVHHFSVLALAFYLGLFVIDGVICFFDASQQQPESDCYRTARWRRRLVSAILGATVGVFPVYLLFMMLAAFVPKLLQTPPLQLFEIFSTVGAGIGYCFPSLAYVLLWFVAFILRVTD